MFRIRRDDVTLKRYFAQGMRIGTRLIALPVAVAAGAVALAGVLWESGVRRGWVERFRLGWTESSEHLAQRGYDEFLSGRRSRGLELFRLAVERDPASPYRWCDYAEALLGAGERVRAREAMRRGVELGPWVGPVRMRAANFGHMTNDGALALEQGRALTAMTAAYDEQVFAVWERMKLPVAEMLERGIPDGRTGRAYLRRCMGRGDVMCGRAAWAWLVAHRAGEDGIADAWAGFLVRVHESDAAVEAWAAQAGGRERGYPRENVVFNGGFERESAGTVFDWRVTEEAGAQAERDEGEAAEGKASLRVTFDGSRNVTYGHVSQLAVVSAGAYRFEARMRTEGITTGEGLGFRIVDAEAPQRLDVATERLTGTHGWTKLAVSMEVGAGTRLVEVRLVRSASWKFDSKLAGCAWVDSVALRPE